MDDILGIWNAHEADVITSVVRSARNEREHTRLLQDAETARLQRQIAEDRARTEFLEMTVDELARFRAWLRERGETWQEIER